MMLSFKNKHAIVCGSTDGIGRSTAQLLASLGCEVTLIARNQKKLERVKKGIIVFSHFKYKYFSREREVLV